MSFLHCHSCGFQQDDFWHTAYNPIRCLQDWVNDLLNEDLMLLYDEKNLQEIIALECEKAATKIRKMMYRTEKEYKQENPKGVCPFCGGKLDID